jgi:hypothetical protein
MNTKELSKIFNDLVKLSCLIILSFAFVVSTSLAKSTNQIGFPARNIGIGAIKNQGFYVPNSSLERVDLGAIFKALLISESNSITSKLRAMNDANSKYVFEGGIESLVFAVNNPKLEFGVNKNGEILKIKEENSFLPKSGKINIKIKELKVLLQVFDRGFMPQKLVASAQTQFKSFLNIGAKVVEVDLGAYQNANELISESQIGYVIRDYIQKALKSLEKNPATNSQIEWQTFVFTKYPTNYLIELPIGTRDSVFRGDTFSVYDNHDNKIGDISITNVYYEKAYAGFMDDVGNSKFSETRVGDKVEVVIRP